MVKTPPWENYSEKEELEALSRIELGRTLIGGAILSLVGGMLNASFLSTHYRVAFSFWAVMVGAVLVLLASILYGAVAIHETTINEPYWYVPEKFFVYQIKTFVLGFILLITMEVM